ncbi:MAG: hypothetical protein OXL41_05850 [Nitrospinae bacterium]|nr:hypothetical protein [Nitrospinota bacterium]
MPIQEMTVWDTAVEVAQGSRNRYGGASTLERVVVRLTDDTGAEGWGEAAPLMYITKETGSDMAATLREAAPRIRGMAADELLAALDEVADFKGKGAARTALEIAAVDLSTKNNQAPFSHVFGGHKRNAVTLDAPIGLLPPDEAIEKAEAAVAQGVRTLKVKSGVDMEADAERIVRLRERFGPDIKLRTDANGGFTPEEALRFTDRMVEIDLEHFEQPVLPSEEKHIDVFREIRARGMQVALDESLFSIDDARRLVDEDACDIGLIKIAKFGGPRNAWEVARVFDAAGKPALLSSPYESYIAKSAGFALALSLENADRAHELAHLLDEEPYAEWHHSISGGEFTLADVAGHGASGIPARVERIARTTV